MSSVTKSKQIFIVGDGAFAQIAYEYFTHDSEYEVVAFAVEKEFMSQQTLFGLPVVPYEDLLESHPPGRFGFFAALAYNQLNRLRHRFYRDLVSKNYEPVSYISSRAFVWGNVQLGDHVFIFEDNTLQPFVTVGPNTVIWSGNHIGHHSQIGRNCFISSHVVISGFVSVGDNCFLGVNSTISNNLEISADTFVGMNASVSSGTNQGAVVKGQPSKVVELASYRYFSIENPNVVE